MNTMLSSLVYASAVFLLFALLRGWRQPLPWAAGIMVALYLGVDDLLTGAPRIVPALNVIPSHWNWEGKFLALMFGLAIVLWKRYPASALGIRWRVAHPISSILATIALLGLSSTLGLIFKPEAPDAQTLAFQLTMPGLVEELSYRSIAPLLLLGVAGIARAEQHLPWRVVLITGLSFGLWHGLSVDHAGLQFDWMSAAMPTIGGLAYGWLRFRSGTVWLPMLAHAGGNTLFLLMPQWLM